MRFRCIGAHVRRGECGLFGIFLLAAAIGQPQGDDRSSVASASIRQNATPAISPPGGPPTFSVDAHLVLIPVTVTDRSNRLVTNLARENFRVFDGSQEQKIVSFTSEEAPVSVGVVLDCSSSMGSKLAKAKAAVDTFLRRANAQDEFFLVRFNDRARLVEPFTSEVPRILHGLADSEAGGATALLDAAYLALAEMKNARNSRKGLLIVSDGGDNHSRITEKEIRNRAKEADVQIYAIGVYSPHHATAPEEAAGQRLMAGITGQTGGRQFKLTKLEDLPDIVLRIGEALRHQYMLGFVPQDLARGGKYRKVEVKLVSPRNDEHPQVFWRHGYYAPPQ